MINRCLSLPLLLLSILFNSAGVSAQCTGGTGAGTLTPTTGWQSVSMAGGTYYNFVATTGTLYHFSFCSADGGNSTFDTQLTLLDSAGAPVSGFFNDDFCGSGARVMFNPTVSGTYRVLANRYNCLPQPAMGNMVYRAAAIQSCPAGLGNGVTAISSLPYNIVNQTTAGQVNDCNAATMSNCNTIPAYDGQDRVYYFTAAATGNITITLTNTASSVLLAAYEDCPLAGRRSSCMGTSFGNNTRTLNFCVIAGKTYYVLVDQWATANGTGFTYNLSITAPVNTACATGTVLPIAALPYNANGRSTCGAGNDITAANALPCGNTSFMSGEDEVFSFTPVNSGKIRLTLSSAAYNTSLYLYETCPMNASCSNPPSGCIGNASGTPGNKIICADVVAGKTYYAVADASAGCYTYNISITAPSAGFTGATCANPVNIVSLPFIASMENTTGMGNDYSKSSPGSCGTMYESGEDKVYRYIAGGPECISLTITGASTNNIGYQVYRGCPDVSGTNCIRSGGGAFSGTLAGTVNLPAAGTYYIIIDTWANPKTAEYNLTIAGYGGNQENDTPCNAEPLVFGITTTGDNNCSGGTGEPAPPACWTSPNILNTVWYSFTAPASGAVTLRTSPGSLLNTQIAVYAGNCGSSLAAISCNDNAAACSMTSTQQSQLTVTGLTPGLTYYVAVDGFGALTGSFGIVAMNAGTPLPTVYGQEAAVALPVCNDTIAVGDPGFQSFGNYCDFPGGGNNCLAAGERGTVWYEIPVNANGNLEFSIIPNDWLGAPSLSSTDYDFALYKISGAGAVTFANIATNSTPVKCNYSALGVTGLYGAANFTAPPAHPGYGGSYMSRQPVLAGEKYLLVVSNFSNSLSGFTLVFPPTAPISYSTAPDTVFWSGSTDTDWFKSANWGGCAIPGCTRSAMILPNAANQPVINGIGASTQSIIVEAGATLTINANRNLNVCGNFVNKGSLNARNNASVTFNGSGNQQLIGDFTNNNDLMHLLINKSTGSVQLMNDVDISGNLTFSHANSFLNGNGKRIKLKGNFNNASGGTFTPGSGGLLKFTGTGTQAYQHAGDLENVEMANTGTGLSLFTNLNIGSNGTLNLLSGPIQTNAFEVNMKNNASAAISSGNQYSFIQGFLRRRLPATPGNPRMLDFPVGHNGTGFQRINISTYNGNSPALQSLRVNFTSWASGPPAAVGTDPSCPVKYNVSGLDNGYWTVTPQGSGNLDMHVTLYNRAYNNASSAFTIMHSTNGNWSIPPINSGSCVSAQVTSVLRPGITENFTSGNGISFGTAQGSSALPVTLLAFSADAKHQKIVCTWTTASEVNNKGFEVLRATDPDHFSMIGWVEGKGTTNNMQEYAFTDEEVKPNQVYYYRLQQMDYDGQFSLTPIVACIVKDQGMAVMEAYPNPYHEATTIRYVLTRPSMITVEINDASGKLVKRYQQGLQDAGIYTMPFSAKSNGLSAGNYTVTLLSDDQRYQVKLSEQE